MCRRGLSDFNRHCEAPVIARPHRHCQAIGRYRAGEGAGLIGAVVGALIVLFIYGMVAGHRARA